METFKKRKLTEEFYNVPAKRLKQSDKMTFDIFKNKFSKETMQAISEMGFEHITRIQLFAIPPIMLNHDVIGVAKTGSGKTLAFLLPIVEKLAKIKFKLKNSLGAIIITPTRELAIQIQNVLVGLAKKHDLTHSIAIGGTKLTKETKELVEGTNILIATPGRLLHHLTDTVGFNIKKLRLLVIDEVDRMLDTGFERDMKKILNILSTKNRQTLMFSATKSEKVLEIKELALRNDPVIIDVDKEKQEATITNLTQYYAICPTNKRFLYLHYFLMKSRKKKVMIFFDTSAEIEFFYNFYKSFDNGINLIQLHGQKKQSTRTNTFLEFCEAGACTIFCTDIAARGLDMPDVDFILQYDPPKSYREYIHRVGRTARGNGKIGTTLLLLQPTETDYIEHLKNAKIPVEEFTILWEKVKNHEAIIQNVIANDVSLQRLAKEAYKKYLQAYRVKGRKLFDGSKLNFEDVVHSFGFKEPLVNFKSLFKSTFMY